MREGEGERWSYWKLTGSLAGSARLVFCGSIQILSWVTRSFTIEKVYFKEGKSLKREVVPPPVLDSGRIDSCLFDWELRIQPDSFTAFNLFTFWLFHRQEVSLSTVSNKFIEV